MHVAVAGQRAAVADVPVPAPVPASVPASSLPAPDTSEEFAQFQRYMALVKASDNTSVGFAQVGTGTEKKVSFASVGNKKC